MNRPTLTMNDAGQPVITITTEDGKTHSCTCTLDGLIEFLNQALNVVDQRINTPEFQRHVGQRMISTVRGFFEAWRQ